MCPQATIVLLLTSGACASYALLRNRIKDTLARKVINGCLMFALKEYTYDSQGTQGLQKR